ncbi:MAG: Uma2 family endonuclease, partial [Planctomycetes bacterium]|nr:Uma2 family endonuclease [Planctomycetota bacterium]
MAVQLRRRRFTVEEDDRMAESGILGESDRVALLDGEIVEMAAIGSPHAACVTRIEDILH